MQTKNTRKLPMGVASMVAKQVGCTPKYAADVLAGKHNNRNTVLTITIKKKARLILEALDS